jgi:LytS/YehU family sensor histidine kinase
VSTFIPLGRARPGATFETSLLAATTRLESTAEAARAPAWQAMSPARQLGLVFAFWTLIAVCGALSDAAYLALVGRAIDWAQVFRRPLTEQWIWAALTPAVFWLARRVPLERGRLASALALHAVFFLALCALHCAIAATVKGPMTVPAAWHGSLFVLRFLQELYSDIWMYWPLVVIRALLDARRREHERALQTARLQELTADLQLSLLRAQIQPHFLFNTLHAITALLRVDPRAAEDMLADLAEILRASFNDPTSQETALRRELDIVGCYLRIQQRRLGSRLHVALDVDIDTLDCAVPVLALQSLVENAVVHGIAPLNRSGTLWIGARRVGGLLELDVRDDGVGFDPAGSDNVASAGPARHPDNVARAAAATATPRPEGAAPASAPGPAAPAAPARGAGIGLANARERLRHLYGDAQSFAFESTPQHGTRITLRFPYRIVTEAAA